MDTKLEEKLYNDFPDFFRDKNLTIFESCMPWGIETDNGWFDLLYSMCEKIKALNPPESFRFSQVKSKFGTLRVYSIGETDEIYQVIGEAEDASYSTCERCGSREDVKQVGRWIESLCKNCRDKKVDNSD